MNYCHLAHALLVDARRDARHAAAGADACALRLQRLEAALLPAAGLPLRTESGTLCPAWAGKVAAALVVMRSEPGSKLDLVAAVNDVRAVIPTVSEGRFPADWSAQAAAAASAALLSAPAPNSPGRPTTLAGSEGVCG